MLIFIDSLLRHVHAYRVDLGDIFMDVYYFHHRNAVILF